jgi:hypothetical protein
LVLAVDISCPTRHAEDDPRLGRPMCPDCCEYTAAVLFNAYAGDLRRRFTTYLPRHLARQPGPHLPQAGGGPRGGAPGRITMPLQSADRISSVADVHGSGIRAA